MPLFTRAIGLLRQTVNPRITSKAWASQKVNQATKSISGAEQAIGMGVMFAIFLIPSGWILSHLDHYKRRPE